MKEYYYTDGTDRFGPFTLDELRAKNISRTTQVWYQGLDDWTPAGNLPELNQLFGQAPPLPVEQFSSNPAVLDSMYNQRPPKTWLIESILVTLFCCLPFGIAGIVNAAKVESRFHSGDIRGANQAAAEAKKWTMLSFWIGLVVGVLYLIVMLAGLASEF